MCIAIASPAGVNPPDLNTLHICWENNQDGAGFAYPLPNNQGVKIMKGFMSWNDFKVAWKQFTKTYDVKNNTVLIHFRIATHGSRGQDMTHPFPIQYDDGALKKTEYVSDYAVIHNGICSCVNQYRNSIGLSDTATFCKEYLTLFKDISKDWLRSKSTMSLIYKMIDSKMAIIDKTGYLAMTNGFEEFNGNFFSNTSYKENRYTKKTILMPISYEDDFDKYNDYYNYQETKQDKKGKSKKANKHEYGLMQLKTGWYLCSDNDGFYIDIKSQDSADNLFIDKYGNVWERITKQVTNKQTGEIFKLTICFNFVCKGASVYSNSGKIDWHCDSIVDDGLLCR